MLEKDKRYGLILMVASIVVAICTFVGSYEWSASHSFISTAMWAIKHGGSFRETYGEPLIMAWWILLPCFIAFAVGSLARMGALPLSKTQQNG